MPIELERRRTLLYPANPQGTLHDRHLFVLLNDPKGRAQQVLMAPVCSVRHRHDQTCILREGDHELIQHDSYVDYALCRLEAAATLQRGYERRLVFDQGLIDEDVFDRVLAGVHNSGRTKRFVLEFLDE